MRKSDEKISLVLKGRTLFLRWAPYSFINDDIPLFVEPQRYQSFEAQERQFVNRLKRFLKRWPRLYQFLIYVADPSTLLGGKPARTLLRFISRDAVVLNLGSGVKPIGLSTLNVDIYPFSGVDCIADITDLPFEDNSADAIVCEAVLEHVLDPAKLVSEMERTLKPGGYVFGTILFSAPYHDAPSDYWRWTREGALKLFENFEIVELGVKVGPTATLVDAVRAWLATVLSFRIKALHIFWSLGLWLLLGPIKLVDPLLVKLSGECASDFAQLFYLIGKKKTID